MQVARTFGRSGPSRSAIALVAALAAALAVGGAGGYVAKSVATEAPHKAAPAALASQSLSGWAGYRPIRSGLQTETDVTTSNTSTDAGNGSADDCIVNNRHKAC